MTGSRESAGVAGVFDEHRASIIAVGWPVLRVVWALLVGQAATLFLVEDRGPWRSIMDGVSGPQLMIPSAWWPAVFLAGVALGLAMTHGIDPDPDPDAEET